MATIVQGSPDLRQQALEQGLAGGVQNFFAAREDERKKKKFLEAFKAINSSTSYEQAVSGLAAIDPEILSNPQALEMLSGQIDRKFPKQDAVQIEKEGVVQTVATRAGDVSGAIAKAQGMGGRLAQDVTVEDERSSKRLKELIDLEKAGLEQEKFGHKKELDAEKLKLEARRTAAAELRAKRTGLPKPSEKEREVAMLQEVFKFSPERAIRTAYEYDKIDVIPETREVQVTDKLSGKTMIMPMELLGTEAPIPKKGESLWEARIAGTGPMSAFRAALSLPTSYMGLYEPKETEQARQRLRMATQNLIRTLSINDRFPVAEQERIRKELALDPDILIHPDALGRRMIVAHQSLSLELAKAKRDAQDMGLPPKTRAAARTDATEIRNFLTQMNIPEEHLRATRQPSAALPPNAAAYFSPDEWNRLTEEERQEWLSQF